MILSPEKATRHHLRALYHIGVMVALLQRSCGETLVLRKTLCLMLGCFWKELMAVVMKSIEELNPIKA